MSWEEPAPREREAGERSWEVVRSAWESRTRHPRPRRHRGALVAIAVGLAIVAAVLSPPGLAVLGSIRDAVRGEKNAKAALFSLPSPGRMVVESARGVWVVRQDGSKRLLAGYRDASWSPHGLYIAAIHGQELRALEPNGAVHWSLGRPSHLASPRWSFDGYRIAYLDRRELRIVNGDGTGDKVLAVRLAARVATVPTAWRPFTHDVAFSGSDGTVAFMSADVDRPHWAVQVSPAPVQLSWTDDGKLLLVLTRMSVRVYDPVGHLVRVFSPGGTALAVAPRSHRFVIVHPTPTGTSLVTFDANRAGGHTLFTGAGTFTGVSWSPDSRWLVADWPSADQFVFLRSTTIRKVVAVSNIRTNLGANATLEGWCCP